VAEGFARLCPPRGIETDYVSLNDIVITGLEGGYPWFMVDSYTPDASGDDDDPWAIVIEDEDEEGWAIPTQLLDQRTRYPLTIATVRAGLERWIDHLLDHGIEPAEIAGNTLQDLDLNDADCVLQFATWGELRYG